MTRAPGRQPYAVVAGAGISGMAVAAGLTRAGWRVTVLEAAPWTREVGAGISLLTNAQRALDWLGVGGEVRARAALMMPGGDGLRASSGRRMQRPVPPSTWQQAGLSLLVLPRPDLHRVLTAVAAAEVRTGTAVTGVTVTDGRPAVRVRHAGTESSITADVVVGADGVHSVVREAIYPGAVRVVHSGHSVWRGIARPAAGSPSGPGGNTWGPGLEFGRMPLPDGRVYWYAVANMPPGRRFADNRAEVQRRFGGWHDPVPALIAATEPDQVIYHDVLELDRPLPGYTGGRVVLVGDAAHAMTSDLGQGACQALEDAVTLCGLLGAEPIDVALQRYDAYRRPRSQTIALMSRQMGDRKMTSRGWRRRRRDAALRRAAPSDNVAGVAWVADWRPPVPVACAETGETT
jgi:2-polyprenyl-6-methoxyphenol hydroxylase-like FAD-dependent oxidoreductase